MRIWNFEENFVFDDTDPRCGAWVLGGVGFLQFLDVGHEGARFEVPRVKIYVGHFDLEDYAESVVTILDYGVEWEPDFLNSATSVAKEHEHLAYEIKDGYEV